MVVGAAVVLVLLGRYQLVSSGQTWMYRLDRYTGDVSYSVSGKAWRAMQPAGVVPVDVVVTKATNGLLIAINRHDGNAAGDPGTEDLEILMDGSPEHEVIERSVRQILKEQWPGVRTDLRWVRK